MSFWFVYSTVPPHTASSRTTGGHSRPAASYGISPVPSGESPVIYPYDRRNIIARRYAPEYTPHYYSRGRCLVVQRAGGCVKEHLRRASYLRTAPHYMKRCHAGTIADTFVSETSLWEIATAFITLSVAELVD